MDAVLLMAKIKQKDSDSAFKENLIKILSRSLEAVSGGVNGSLSTEKYMSLTIIFHDTATQGKNELLKQRFFVSRTGGCRGPAYSLENTILSDKTKKMRFDRMVTRMGDN
jgi:hypothetical protein